MKLMQKNEWKNIEKSKMLLFRKVWKPLIYKDFLHIFTKNSIFLNVDIVKYLRKYDTKTIVMEETNRQSLYVCSAALLSGIADLEWNQLFLADKNREYNSVNTLSIYSWYFTFYNRWLYYSSCSMVADYSQIYYCWRVKRIITHGS